jgi:hypothetical protein
MLSRILGADMNLLFSLRFLINKASGVKAADHFKKLFIAVNSLLSFHWHIISTLQGIRVCDHLFFEQSATATYYRWLLINHYDQNQGGIE